MNLKDRICIIAAAVIIGGSVMFASQPAMSQLDNQDYRMLDRNLSSMARSLRNIADSCY